MHRNAGETLFGTPRSASSAPRLKGWSPKDERQEAGLLLRRQKNVSVWSQSGGRRPPVLSPAIKEEFVIIEQDTVRLLRECDAGIQMGVQSIDDALPHTQSKKLRALLEKSKAQHERMQGEADALLRRYQDEGKNPPAIAQGMAAAKIKMKLAMNEADATVADLITDGCNMGVKSLSKYLNQYAAADEASKALCARLISAEECLAVGLRDFL